MGTALKPEVGTVERAPSGALVLSGKSGMAPGPTSMALGGSRAVEGLLAWARANPVAAVVVVAGAWFLLKGGKKGRRRILG